MEKKSRPAHLEYVEIIRATACLFVLLSHILATSSKYGIYANGCGKIGVWAFMILSGMLLVYPYYIDSEKSFFLASLPGYYAKKFLRIYPAYALSLVFAGILGIINFTDIPGYLLCLSAYGHFWYIPVIVKFYIVAPVFIIAASRLNKKIFLVLIATLGVALSLIFPFYSYPENSISLLWYLPVFLMGMIVGFIISKDFPENPAFDIFTLLSFALILILTPAFRKLLFGIEPDSYLQKKYLVMGFLWSLVIIFLGKGVRLKALLSQNFIVKQVSALSFYIYLFHYIILQYLLLNHPMPFIFRAALTIVLTVLLSIALNICEKKLRSLKSSVKSY